MRGWEPTDETAYKIMLTDQATINQPKSIQHLEKILLQTASQYTYQQTTSQLASPWSSDEFKLLLQQRRNCRDGIQRRNLTNDIRKYVRQQLRKRKTERINKILDEFADLNRLDDAHTFPVREKRPTTTNDITPDEFGCFLGDLFKSDSVFQNGPVADYLQNIANSNDQAVPDFTMNELWSALKKMRRRKCVDESGIVAEMIKYASCEFLEYMLDCFNNMMRIGILEPSWYETLFIMLPKSGDTTLLANWRPIAILRITYKIFSRLIYQRLMPILNNHQSSDQVGFRPNCSVEDAFIIYETVASKYLE